MLCREIVIFSKITFKIYSFNSIEFVFAPCGKPFPQGFPRCGKHVENCHLSWKHIPPCGRDRVLRGISPHGGKVKNLSTGISGQKFSQRTAGVLHYYLLFKLEDGGEFCVHNLLSFCHFSICRTYCTHYEY